MKYHLASTRLNPTRIAECLTLSLYLVTYEFIFSTSIGLQTSATFHPTIIMMLIGLSNVVYLRFPGFRKRFIRLIRFGLIALATAQFSFYCKTAQAQGLFVPIEQFVRQCFPTSDALVGVTFNSLRVIVLLYLTWALVRSLNAARDGEDWITIARTPLIAMLLLFASQVIANFMIAGVTC